LIPGELKCITHDVMGNYLPVDKFTPHVYFQINELGSCTQGSLHLQSCPTPHLTEDKIKL